MILAVSKASLIKSAEGQPDGHVQERVLYLVLQCWALYQLAGTGSGDSLAIYPGAVRQRSVSAVLTRNPSLAMPSRRCGGRLSLAQPPLTSPAPGSRPGDELYMCISGIRCVFRGSLDKAH
jgi:hypothetical protein